MKPVIEELRFIGPVVMGAWFLTSGAAAFGAGRGTGTEAEARSKRTPNTPLPHVLSSLTYWDDGNSEMSYYRTSDQIYGRQRRYTRVHLLNRQWMDPNTGVKAASSSAEGIPVFKLNIAEEIPTANYNYRYLSTVFLTRPDLLPFKMVASSQEWCGTTFKQLRWTSNGLTIKSFSYFGDEGDEVWNIPGRVVPHEGLFVIAREVAATGRRRGFDVLPPMRSTHEVEPVVLRAMLIAGPAREIHVSAGAYPARPVELDWDGPPTRFDVEAVSPYRLLRFIAGPIRGELQAVERRAYWNREWPSRVHDPGNAP